MRDNTLHFLSLAISGLLLLYLLFSNVLNKTFLVHDWIVVAVDLTSKIIIELVIISKNDKPKIE